MAWRGRPMGRGRGRGREQTLPAWMTNPELASKLKSQGPATNTNSSPTDSGSRKPSYSAKGANRMPIGRGRGQFGMPNAAGRGRGGNHPHMMHNQQNNNYRMPGTNSNAMNAPVAGKSSVWKEYKTPDGRSYYHNQVTNQTTWECPAELKPKPAAVAPPPPSTGSAVYTGPWREYTDGASGRKYYHNLVTKITTWERPPEMDLPAATPVGSAAAAAATGPVGISSGGASHGMGGNRMTTPGERTFNPHPHHHHHRGSGDHALAATPQVAYEGPSSDMRDNAVEFMRMLKDCGVRRDWTWEQAMRATLNDPRYHCLPTQAAKKAAFRSYQVKASEEEFEEIRRRDRELVRDFKQLLEEQRSMPVTADFHDWRQRLEDDPRYKAIPSSTIRQGVFAEYQLDRAKENDKVERKNTIRAKSDFLLALRKDPSITVESQWRKTRDRLSKGTAYRALSRRDRVEVFEEHIRSLEREEKLRERAEAQRERTKAREAREQFRKLLDVRQKAGEITPTASWRTFQASIKNEPAYKQMLDVSVGSTARQLFYDRVDDLLDDYERDRPLIKQIVRDRKITITQDTSLEDFLTAMKASDTNNPDPVLTETYLTIFYKERKRRLEREVEDEARRRERHRRRLLYVLRDARLNPSFTFEEIDVKLKKNRDWQAVSDKKVRRKVFEEYQEDLAKGGSESGLGSKRSRESHKQSPTKDREQKRSRETK